MIENRVGPPVTGIPEFALREAARAPQGNRSGSFEKALDESMRAPRGSPPLKDGQVKAREPKEAEELVQPAETPPNEAGPVEPKMQARERAIQKFMDSFESEFGIPPTEIVGAMALLEPEKLNASPESSAIEVIESLGLDDEDADRALAMYGALLTELKIIDQRPLGKPLPPVAEALPGPLDFRQRHAMASDKRLALNSSVDRLNEKFWMTGAGATRALAPSPAPAALPGGPAAPAVMGWNESALDPAAFSDPSLSDPAFEPTPLEGELAPMPPRAPVLEAPPGVDPKLHERVREMMEQNAGAPRALKAEAPPAEAARVSALTAAGFMAPRMPTRAIAPEALPKSLEAGAPLSAETAAPSMDLLELVGAPSIPEGESSFSGFGGSSDFSESAGEGFAQEGADAGDIMSLKSAPQPLKMEDVAAALKNAAPVAAPMAGAALMQTPEQSDATVRQLMNQAQYLIKRGGGEMKVQMTPEGLGQIQLKVLVQDGKVNVQMAAESSEAKKALESSLPELRSSLAAHKLSMDHVKVDVVSGPSTDTASRNDMQSNANAGREGTRQFWNQFQEQFGNRSRNDGFWDVPALKGYSRTSQRDPLEPVDGQGRPARRVDGKGSGLNLVA